MASSPETLTAGAGERLSGTRLQRLVIVHGREPGRVALIHEETDLLVGRAAPAGWLIDDQQLSRSHFRVSQRDGQVWLEDLGSHNGTFVGGKRVSRCVLSGGECIRAGATLLMYDDLFVPMALPIDRAGEGPAGPSPAMTRVRAELALVASHRLPVLVLGETGVGKELVAAELHRRSQLPGALVPVNCGAVALQLAESEFFGHVPGAFTGAMRRTEGLFSAAHRGTLFLDEVGELPLELQAKLLRALESGEIRPVGSAQAERVEVRLVAATHRDLAAEVRAGRFREDLLARLSTWTIQVPPLRARRQDVLFLASIFLSDSSLSDDAAEALLLHSWPQNVRELKATLEVAKIRAGGGPVRREHLPDSFSNLLLDRQFPVAKGGPLPPLEFLVPRFRTPSRDELVLVLERLSHNVSEVADFFGKDRKQVYRWLERYELTVPTAEG